ncbi:unnamed protein product [Tilletia controversa]|uniref:Large ribosomal subunit protein bL28c n=3 Tax=Tilletia TaxID=13289 RepID=A0A8X7MRH6_9BASI|nr:hypothetical protein CF336_g4684 [Tilletia laevis]KAE8204131.1 hypothetical protein CF328_g1262 [Tilletia controversa]KAE8263792.1 hypothetical protein A4X03_0g1424 [Tilletia caries]KAE8200844.1 hypothetical protein CF335_g3867 [Tilletia laevis]KAE8246182.1 hypothetical protein A4X06_0g5132 [Tilletia controversa]
MFASLVRFSRTTYRGARGSGPGRSGKTDVRSSPDSRPTAVESAHAGFTFKRAQRGLYDGKIIQFGNNIPKSRQKTRRTWLPNVQHQRVFSELLDHHVKMKVTTSALRSIEKAGGLDSYLAKTKDAILGEYGRGLRDMIAGRLAEGRLPGLAKVMDRQRREAQERATAAAAAALLVSKPASTKAKGAKAPVHVHANVVAQATPDSSSGKTSTRAKQEAPR